MTQCLERTCCDRKEQILILIPLSCRPQISRKLPVDSENQLMRLEAAGTTAQLDVVVANYFLKLFSWQV